MPTTMKTNHRSLCGPRDVPARSSPESRRSVPNSPTLPPARVAASTGWLIPEPVQAPMHSREEEINLVPAHRQGRRHRDEVADAAHDSTLFAHEFRATHPQERI